MIGLDSRPTLHRHRVKNINFPWTAFVVYTIVFSVYGITRVNTYLSCGYDLGIFDQVVQHYAHFQAPISTLKGDDYNIWGDHFHPIIALWAPLYWIWDNVRVIIIGQAIVAASAIFPLWRITRRHMGQGWWAKAFSVAILFGWPIQCLIDFDVHEIAFAVPLLAWVIDGLDRHADKALLIACVLLLMVREDMGTLVFIAGFIRLVWGCQNRRRTARDWLFSGGLMVGGLAFFALVTTVVLPHFAPAGYQYWDYPVLTVNGSGPGAWLVMLGHAIVAIFLPATKIWTWFVLLVPVGFLCLGSPYGLLAVPIMAERMLADREHLWSTHFHYNAPVWIIICLAAVDAVDRLPQSWVGRMAVGARRVFRSKGASREAVHDGLAKLLLGSQVLATLFAATQLFHPITDILPFSRMLTTAAFRVDASAQARGDAVAWLPANTCVVADDRIASQLTHTNRVTVPGVSDHRQDFYALDLSQVQPATTPANWSTEYTLTYAEYTLGFSVVFQSGSVVILESPDYAGPDPVNCGPGAS